MMPKDSNGKDIVCHVVDLQPSDLEYQEVHTAFTSTMPPAGSAGGDVWKGVVKIQRIQNPALYAQYAGRKKIMEKAENPRIQNERRLFMVAKEKLLKIFTIKDSIGALLVPMVSVAYTIIAMYVYSVILPHSNSICDWILENRSKSHIWYLEKYQFQYSRYCISLVLDCSHARLAPVVD